MEREEMLQEKRKGASWLPNGRAQAIAPTEFSAAYKQMK
jgi:hypothetical protein